MRRLKCSLMRTTRIPPLYQSTLGISDLITVENPSTTNLDDCGTLRQFLSQSSLSRPRLIPLPQLPTNPSPNLTHLPQINSRPHPQTMQTMHQILCRHIPRRTLTIRASAQPAHTAIENP